MGDISEYCGRYFGIPRLSVGYIERELVEKKIPTKTKRTGFLRTELSGSDFDSSFRIAVSLYGLRVAYNVSSQSLSLKELEQTNICKALEEIID